MKYSYRALKLILFVTIIIASACAGTAQIAAQKSVGQALIEAIKINEPLTFCMNQSP